MEQTKLKLVSSRSIISETPNKGGSKREATSPLHSDLTSLKKTRPDMLGELQEVSDAEGMVDIQMEPGTAGDVHVLSQPMNPSDIINVAKELRSIMFPELRSIIEGFKPYIKETVTEAVLEATKGLNNEIKQLKKENSQLIEANAQLATKNVDLEKRLAAAESGNDSLEQYSRRNSLRISGIEELPNENTDELVLSVAHLLHVKLDARDIDRSHRVGKIGLKDSEGQVKHRQIIVKFATYNARQRLYSMRKELKEPQDDHLKGIFLSEDLTKSRSKLLFDARTLARANKLQYAYASDGKIFVKDNDDDRHLIKSTNDLNKFGDLKQVKKELAARAQLIKPSRLTGLSFGATGSSTD